MDGIAVGEQIMCEQCFSRPAVVARFFVQVDYRAPLKSDGSINLGFALAVREFPIIPDPDPNCTTYVCEECEREL